MRRAAHRTISSTIWLWIVAILFALAIVLLLLRTHTAREWWYDMQENRAYAAHPSATLALEDGDNHLDSVNHPQEYDIARAQYFFQLAAELDPNLPTVFHQLARVAFLEDKLPVALAYIDIQIERQGNAVPSSYYMRGLIEGYMADYADAERDYGHFLQLDPINWAGVNDYSWVLLKDNKPAMAAAAIEAVLPDFPNNPWLLNSDAIALSESGEATTAKERIDAAEEAVQALTPSDWSLAYPGNDPAVGSEGLKTFRQAVEDNMHKIDAATASSSQP
jgi:tetratricopeptide (TPR) repeat protein